MSTESVDQPTGKPRYPRFAPDAELVVDMHNGPEQWTGSRWNEYVSGAERNFNMVTARLIECPEPTTDPDPEQVWDFTFGSGQRFDGRYVTITGTYESARAEMVRHFGTAWCDQYRNREAAGVDSELLPRDEWPTPTITAADLKPGVVAAFADDGHSASFALGYIAETLRDVLADHPDDENVRAALAMYAAYRTAHERGA